MQHQAMSEPTGASAPKKTPSHDSGSAPDRIYTGGKIGKWFGKLFGGEGKRAGARDTDPGH